MSLLVFLFFVLTNFYTSAISDTKCKEYLIIIRETFCPTNSSIIREPIKLNDLKFDHNNCSEDSLEILSDYENSNKSYIVKFDYIGFESICIPIFKSTKLLEYIQDDENETTYEEKELDKHKHEINKTTLTEINDSKTYPLECLIKNYKQTCDKKEILTHEIRKKVGIDLIHSNKLSANVTEIIYNNTGESIIFEKCVLNEYLCTNSNTIDHYNDTITQIILTSIGNNDSSVFWIENSNINNLNCTNIINKHENINISYIKVLANNVITKYFCQDEEINNRNLTLPIYDVSVYLSIDLNILNTALKYINCTGNFEPKYRTELSIDCYVQECVEMHIKDNYTIINGNNIFLDIDSFEVEFNQSLVYYCKLNKVNTTRDSYSETVEIFNKYKVFEFRNCTEEFSTDDKKPYPDGSKILIFFDEGDKDNLTNLEDFGSYDNRKSLELQFVHNNISDCSRIIPLNISKGRIFSLWPEKDDDFNSTFIKLIITNCENFKTKHLENENNLELDIILMNSNNTRLHNETKVNKLKNILWNYTNGAILNCDYFNENTRLKNIYSELECIFLESNNDNTTTTIDTPTPINAIENKNGHLNDRHNDSFDVSDKSINATIKTPKETHFGGEPESIDNKSLNGNVTTETNTWRDKAAVQRNQTNDNDPLQEMYYVSPRVLTTAIVALLATVGSVLTYALCLFKKKKQEYRPTPTRDWTEMDATQF